MSDDIFFLIFLTNIALILLLVMHGMLAIRQQRLEKNMFEHLKYFKDLYEINDTHHKMHQVTGKFMECHANWFKEVFDRPKSEG